MTDIANILRLASDGYDVRDIRKFTRVPIPEIKQICKNAGVKLEIVTERAKPIITIVKKSALTDLLPTEKAVPKMLEVAPPPRSKQNPLVVAQMWLGKRLVEKPSGYWLDNRPVNLTGIMKAANGLIKAEGGEQIGHHPGWLV